MWSLNICYINSLYPHVHPGFARASLLMDIVILVFDHIIFKKFCYFPLIHLFISHLKRYTFTVTLQSLILYNFDFYFQSIYLFFNLCLFILLKLDNGSTTSYFFVFLLFFNHSQSKKLFVSINYLTLLFIFR